VLAPRDDEHPMVTMTHLSSFQTPTTDSSHGDSSSREELYVRDAHRGHVDPQIQEEIQNVQTIDLTHTDQHEERDAHHGHVDPQIQEEIQDV
jgi:hypothetical protein